MGILRLLLFCMLTGTFGVAAANNDSDDGFIWIDANTRIKVKPVSASSGATAPEKAPKKAEKKEKPKN